MTRAREPIHSHLVICRHFDLPQRSSISIRGGRLAGDDLVYVYVCVCICMSICVCVGEKGLCDLRQN